MLPFATLRELFRIPWVYENREAIHVLSEMFYLLVALFRARRMQEFCWLQNIFFNMIDSFVLYGRRDAKTTIDQLLNIPWFRTHQRDLYRAIAAYNRVIASIREAEEKGPSIARQKLAKKHVKEFAYAFKEIINFNEDDDERVLRLLNNRELIDKLLEKIANSLG